MVMKQLVVSNNSFRNLANLKSFYFKSTTVIAAEGYEVYVMPMIKTDAHVLPLWVQLDT